MLEHWTDPLHLLRHSLEQCSTARRQNDQQRGQNNCRARPLGQVHLGQRHHVFFLRKLVILVFSVLLCGLFEDLRYNKPEGDEEADTDSKPIPAWSVGANQNADSVIVEG